MTPTPSSPAAPWWQTVVATVANVGIGILVNHFLGPVAGVASVGAGTAVAHVLPSPRSQRGR